MDERDWTEIFLESVIPHFSGCKTIEKWGTESLILSLGIHANPILKLKKKKQVGEFTLGLHDNCLIAESRCEMGPLHLELLLHTVALYGIKQVWGLGAVGAIDPSIGVGDLIIPETAIGGDGLSPYLSQDYLTAEGDKDMLNQIKQVCQERKCAYHRGKIFTTGSFMAETDGFIKAKRNEGCIGIECETAPLYFLCRYLGMRAAVLLVASDNPAAKVVFSQSSILKAQYARGLSRAKAVLNDALVVAESSNR